MNPRSTSLADRLARLALMLLLSPLASSVGLAQTDPSGTDWAVVDIGPYYQVLQRTVSVTNNSTGEISSQVQSFTELQDGMNYLCNGVWVAAQDLIEVTPTGAQAIHGQMTANFSSDITRPGAIYLTTAAGEVFQSHPVGLFYTDYGSGKVAQIGSVQQSVGTLYPPNVVVFSNVLSRVRADLMLVWAKNGYEQNLVLKQSPPMPESFGLSSGTTTLQFWSAMDSCPVPQQQRPVQLPSGLQDHILIFGSSWFPVGGAFAFGSTPLPAATQPTQIRVIDTTAPGVIPVAKSLVNVSGQQVLIEEVKYTDLITALGQLPQASVSIQPSQPVELAQRGTFLKPVVGAKPAAKPIEVAENRYEPKGVVLDYMELSGSANSFTFTNYATYHISNNFSVGPGTATFQSACIKCDTNAYLLVSGSVVCSGTSGAPTVFTSKDDNGYGAIITNSTANPGYAASKGIWMYYQTFSTTLQDVLVRWAQTGIRYDGSSSQPHLYYAALQDCTTGVYMNVNSNTLYLASDTYCNVATPIASSTDGPPKTSGDITNDCGVVTVAMVNDPKRDSYDYDTNKNSQTECSFVVIDSTNIVAAFMSTHLSEYGLGSFGVGNPVDAFPGIPSPRMATWAISRDGGTNFMDNGPIPPISTITNGSMVVTNGATDPTLGDAGDTVTTYDSSSNVVYLVTNPSREPGFLGFRLWASANKGTNFVLVNTNVPGNSWVSSADKPMLKANPKTGELFVAGSTVYGDQTFAARSLDGGHTWTNFQCLATNVESRGTDIVIIADNTAYVFWLETSGTVPNYVNQLRYACFPTNRTWGSSANFGSHLNSTNFSGGAQLLRFNGDDTNDWLGANSYPRLAFASGHIYVAYCDAPSPGSPTDRGDIFLLEGNVNGSDHTVSVGYGPRKVNNDRTQTDQWNPSMAADPSGTELFIGYYSRQEDAASNSWIKAYGAKAYITNGLANATFECFPISPTNFLPLYAGTVASSNSLWTFEPVWPPAGVCLTTNSVYNGPWSGGTSFCRDVTDPFDPLVYGTFYTYVDSCADDYTWSYSDSNSFYLAWCDRSRTNGLLPNVRPDADIKFARIKH